MQKTQESTQKGVDTSAVFGFVNTLNELIRKENPTHIGVVFDTNKPQKGILNFLNIKHTEMQCRKVLRTIKYIDKLLIAFNIPKIFKDGYGR